MKTYTVLYASDVPHYASFEVEARSPREAITAAKTKINAGDVLVEDPDWEGCILKRIVHIEDDAGNSVANDIPLDDYRLQYIAGTVPQVYCIGINNDDGGCCDIVLKQNDRSIATLIAGEGEVAPLVHAGNCHEDLLGALRMLREEVRALPITIFKGPFYDAMLAADRALEKAGGA